MARNDISSIRKEYTRETLEPESVTDDPIVQFNKWFEQAQEADVPEVNAMTLATVSGDGQPTARIVLLKDIEKGRFLFYTNYTSRKGDNLTNNPKAALVFFWPELERQVRIEGTMDKVPGDKSTDYFHSRPRGSQIGAWTSPQSNIIKDREELENRKKELEEKFAGQEIPRPEFWGGYALTPARIEFWQGRASRLHDRILFEKTGEEWRKQRLAP
ncbi:MAG: pyridoxamine 5'-phosphate oxidase [Cyclobacteriaceae bacterium]